jgi:hypothetical protein
MWDGNLRVVEGFYGGLKWSKAWLRCESLYVWRAVVPVGSGSADETPRVMG